MAPDPTAPTASRRGKPGPAGGTGPLGLVLPTFPQQRPAPPDATELSRLCAGAEAAGAGALWACDHLYWHGPVLECFSALATAAGATTSAAVGTCVLQLPLRRAEAVAKQAASLHHLSAGRLVLGVGAGSRRGEYEAAGVDFASRGRALDDGIERIRRAWDASGPGAAGGYRQLPTPGAVPLWIGGSSEAALRRAARCGDGWIPLFLSPGEFRAAQSRLDKESERAGRDPAVIERAMVVFASVDGDDPAARGLAWMSSLYGIPERAFAPHLVAGTARECSQALERYVEAGATHIAVFVASDDPLLPFGLLATEFAGRIGPRPVSSPARAEASAPTGAPGIG